jgi:helix-turn-helix protein
MSHTEKKIADSQGQYLQAVGSGQRLTDATWQPCRIVLTTERMVLMGEDERELPLSAIERIDDRFDVNQRTASVSNSVTVHLAADVILVNASDHAAFETDLFRAALDGEIIFVSHPAVEGGVVQNTECIRARVTVSNEALRRALDDGSAGPIERAEIGDLQTEEKDVAGEERTVLAVEHTLDDISVETHLAGPEFQATVLEMMLGESADRNRADLDLSNTELRVVMALHSGVSPFDIPSFAGIEVEQCEALFDRLIELDVIDVVRERTEVQLTTKGRRVAGETMGEQ